MVLAVDAPRLVLGGRPTVGHVALDHVIGVRIPASQPHSLTSQARSFGWSARLSGSIATCSRTPRMVPNPCLPATLNRLCSRSFAPQGDFTLELLNRVTAGS